MLRMNLSASLLSLGLHAGCGSAQVQQPPATPPPAPAKPTGVTPVEEKPTPAEQFAFSASATDATEGQATERAQRRLLVALLDEQSLMNEDAFSNRLSSVVHDAESDPLTVSSNSDGITVLVGLRKERLAAALDRLEAALAPEDASDTIALPAWPKPLAQAIFGARSAHLLATLCERRRALIEGSECEPADFKEADRELLALTKSLTLTPFYADGSPVRAGVRLRPLRVLAELSDRTRNAPVGQLPLTIEGAGLKAPVLTSTDREGQLKLKWPEGLEPEASVKVSIDGAKTFGPLSENLPEISIQVGVREVGLARTAIVAVSSNPSIEAATPSLLEELRGTMNQPVELAPADEQQLAQTSVAKMSKVTPALADRLKGELDTIVLFNASSEFASRMGTHRVWYEARGTLKVVNAWTGELLSEVSAQVTESGVGEPRAERAAQQTLGRELAKKLKAQLENQGTAVSAAP